MSNKNYQTARGFKDYNPTESLERLFIMQRIRRVFHRYNYLPIETPVIERSETLLDQHGGEAKKLMLHVLNSGDFMKGIDKVDGSNDLRPSISDRIMRYDYTASLRRFMQDKFAKETLQKKKEMSVYQMGPVFRGDRPQKGRLRQFIQCDADKVYTNNTPEKEGEVMKELVDMIDQVMDSLGIKGYQILVNHRNVSHTLLETWNKVDEADKYLDIMSRYDEDSFDGMIEEMGENGITKLLMKVGKVRVQEKQDDIIKYVWDDKEPENKNTYMLTPFLVRGLSYYDGYMFEVKVKGESLSLLGGGGYSVGKDRGIGFSFGLDRLHMAWTDQREGAGLTGDEFEELI